MIAQALEFIRNRLNGYLGPRFPVGYDIVNLAPLTDADGKFAAANNDRLAMFLTNIEHDKIVRSRRSGGQVEEREPWHLDIFFMIAAAHSVSNYNEGLKQLSAALQYFQSTPVFSAREASDMPEGIFQLSIEMSNQKLDNLGQMWGNFGGRYLPSAMFRMRSVAINSGAVAGVHPVIRKLQHAALPGEE